MQHSGLRASTFVLVGALSGSGLLACANVVTAQPGDQAPASGDPLALTGDSLPGAGDEVALAGDQAAGDPGGDLDVAATCDGQSDGTVETRLRWGLASVPLGGECPVEVQARTCAGGDWSAWSGSYQHETCQVRRPILAVSGDAASEGTALGFRVTLSEAALVDIAFTWLVEPGTATLDDFLSDGGSASVAAGALEATLRLSTRDDEVCEGDEELAVVITSCDGCLLATPARAIGTILEDDFAASPLISITDANAVEGATALFAVTLDCPALHPVEIAWTPLAGSAAADEDFDGASGHLTIPARSTAAVISIAILDDAVPEPPETFVLHADAVSGGTAPSRDAVGTIARSDMHAWTAGGATGAATFLASRDGVLFIAGHPGLNHNATFSWRVEKRAALDGGLDEAFGTLGVLESDPTPGRDPLAAIAITAAGLFLAGSQAEGAMLSHWRVEKRDPATGVLDPSFGLGGVEADTDQAGTLDDLAADTSFLFLAGRKSTSWVEKRAQASGALESGFGTAGAVVPACSPPLRLALAAGGLYVVGRRTCASNQCVVIERRDPATGSLDATFGTGGEVEFGGGQYGMNGPVAIAASGDALFILGYGLYPNPALLAKRSLADGSAVTAFDGDGQVAFSGLSAYPMGVAVDASGVYSAGWRVVNNRGTGGVLERRDATSGVRIAQLLYDPAGESYLGTGGLDGFSAVALGDDLVITAGATGAPDPSYPDRTWWYARRVFLDP